MSQVLASLFWDHSGFVILSSDRANGFNGIPEHDRNELDLVPGNSPQQVATDIAFDFADARQEFRFQHGLIRVCVLGLGITMPDSCDH